jgi:hypothetical protein
MKLTVEILVPCFLNYTCTRSLVRVIFRENVVRLNVTEPLLIAYFEMQNFFLF